MKSSRDASEWRQRSVAGGSATAAFDRRTTRHQERVRTNRPWILLAGLVIVAVGLGLATVDRWAIAGWLLVAVGVLSTLGRLFLAPNNVRAWSIGATGEARVGALYPEPTSGPAMPTIDFTYATEAELDTLFAFEEVADAILTVHLYQGSALGSVLR